MSRLRAVIGAKDEQIAALTASLETALAGLEASRERERRLELRVGGAGAPPVDGQHGFGDAQPRRSGSGRRRRGGRGSSPSGSGSKDRKRGGQPGHQGKGLKRDPDPGETQDRGAAGGVPVLPGVPGRRGGRGAAVGAGHRRGDRPEGDRVGCCPGLLCPCCGTVTFAEPPPGAHAGSVSYGPVLNAAAVLLSCLRERAAGAGRAGHRHAARHRGLRRAGWIRPPPGSTRSCGKAGFDEAMLAALAARGRAGRRRDPGERHGQDRCHGRGTGGEGRADPEEKDGKAGGRGAARADHPDPGRAADVPAGHRLPPQGRRRRRGSRPVHRVPDHRRLHRLPAPPRPGSPASSSARQHVIRRCRAVTKLGPGGLQNWAGDIIAILRDAHAGRRGGPRPRQTPPWTSRSSMTCANATTPPSPPG